MHLPESQSKAVKARGRAGRIPYQRFIRVGIEEVLAERQRQREVRIGYCGLRARVGCGELASPNQPGQCGGRGVEVLFSPQSAERVRAAGGPTHCRFCKLSLDLRRTAGSVDCRLDLATGGGRGAVLNKSSLVRRSSRGDRIRTEVGWVSLEDGRNPPKRPSRSDSTPFPNSASRTATQTGKKKDLTPITSLRSTSPPSPLRRPRRHASGWLNLPAGTTTSISTAP